MIKGDRSDHMAFFSHIHQTWECQSLAIWAAPTEIRKFSMVPTLEDTKKTHWIWQILVAKSCHISRRVMFVCYFCLWIGGRVPSMSSALFYQSEGGNISSLIRSKPTLCFFLHKKSWSWKTNTKNLRKFQSAWSLAIINAHQYKPVKP